MEIKEIISGILEILEKVDEKELIPKSTMKWICGGGIKIFFGEKVADAHAQTSAKGNLIVVTK